MNKSTTESSKKYSHLQIDEREELAISLNNGDAISVIAQITGRHRSTLYREIKRNGAPKNKVEYRANRAQLRSDIRKKQTHNRARIKNPETRDYVESKLKEDWSPELIAGRLAIEKPALKTNHESIYLWIYDERQDLIKFLPKAHKTRRKRGSAKGKRAPKVPNRVMIDQRPTEVSDREIPGHWEADTAVSRASTAAIAVTAERVSSYVQVRKIESKAADNMDTALTDMLGVLPEHMRRTITYDNGTENARHEVTNDKLNTKSYFCNPYHSWEKGCVENRIGAIRKYFPKKTNWALISQKDLDTVTDKINARPMKRLGYRTPTEVFVALNH